MKSIKTAPSPWRHILFLYMVCDCGSDYLREEGGSIAYTHHINKKKKIDEVYSCNACGRNYRIQAKRGHIKIFQEKRTRIKRHTL